MQATQYPERSRAAVPKVFDAAAAVLSREAGRCLIEIAARSYAGPYGWGPMVLPVEPWALEDRLGRRLRELIPLLDELLSAGFLEADPCGYVFDPEKAEAAARGIRGAGR